MDSNSSHSKQLNLVPTSRVSRDEMNLAEFPLTVLSTRASPTIKTLEFKDTIHTKNGEMVTREWTITAADKFGLPTASDDELLLGLLKLTVDQGFNSRKVFFTRYELLKALRWTTEGRNYSRIQKGLDRLSGVRIKATNAFFDNSTKSHSTVNFGLIDAYEINDGRDGTSHSSAPSFFVWSEVLYDSFKVGYIKKIDLDFYLGLKSAVSKRLYRYLDKHFWYRGTIRINVFVLSHEKLGVSRNYRYVSLLRQQLDPALNELAQAGFVSSFHYEGRGPETEIVICSARKCGRSKVQPQFERELKDNPPISPSDVNMQQQSLKLTVQNEDNALSLTTEFDQIKQTLRSELISRGIREALADNLLANRSIPMLHRIKRIIAHYDQLLSKKSRLVSVNPVGFLYRAVETPERFNLPDDPSSHSSSEARAKLNKPSNFQRSNGPDQTSEKERVSADILRSEYLIERKREILSLQSRVEKRLLSSIELEVVEALSKMRGLVTEAHFNKAVELGVEERLAKLFALPTFDQWCAKR